VSSVFRGRGPHRHLDFFTPSSTTRTCTGRSRPPTSLSDVVRDGGEPLFALAIAAFPEDEKILPYLADVMAGGAAKAKEAGICIIGGHTVKDKEPKFGLSVTGRVHPDGCGTTGARRPATHRPDEAPGTHRHLGNQVGDLPEGDGRAVTGSMARLNANAAKAGGRSDLTATDVTGFA